MQQQGRERSRRAVDPTPPGKKQARKKQARKKQALTLGVLAMLGLLAAGCGHDAPDPGKHEASAATAASPTALPQKLSKPETASSPEPDGSPAADADLADNLGYELRRKTLTMAGAPGRTTARCPKNISGTKGSTVTCTTTYEGLTITWTVTLGDKAAWSDHYVTFDATPDRGLLTQVGVARLLYGNFRDSIDYAACNDIPKAVLAPLNRPSKYTCEVVMKGNQPTGNGDAVRATEAGPRVH